jgi:hypothetical protein
MVDWQTVAALSAVGVAVSYLAWGGWRTWRGRRRACGGGCGSACGGAAKPENSAPSRQTGQVLIPRAELGLRRRQS